MEFEDSNCFVHYFKGGSNDIYIYDVIQKEQKDYSIDREIPYNCGTIAIDKNRIFVIGGELDDDK